MKGPVLAQEKIAEALESVIVAGDRIVMEGDNQKQADFLSRSLVQVDAKLYLLDSVFRAKEQEVCPM
jgi:malonate decarboxylase alpha subunit